MNVTIANSALLTSIANIWVKCPFNVAYSVRTAGQTLW